MTAFCTMKLLCQATRNQKRYAERFFGTLLTQTPQKISKFSPFWMVVPDPRKSTEFELTQSFCTAEKSHMETKRKTAFGSVGRRIPYRILHVINQDGESLGDMHRAEALKLMDQHDLKLVLLHENTEPPVYRLMTGQQIHEEQLKRAKKKTSSKPGVVQKELSFSSTIAKNDLETKTKQITQWIEKKYHVKVTIRQAKDSNTDMFMVFDKILETVSEKATYLSKPKVTREGVSSCILRHMSDKELNAYRKMKDQKNSTVKKDENEDLKSNKLHP